jgi:O-antigen/teichoic acid export membrane protein
MSASQSSYRQILKATSVFGGVQVFQILIAIVRTKLVAVLLGTAGMGISSLFTSVIGLISGVSGLGLNISAVRNISEANATGHTGRINLTVSVFRKLIWVTGILGMIFVIVFAGYLSNLTFGNSDQKFAFVWLSVTILLSNLVSGQYVVLQGFRKIKHLAKANVFGATLGLLVSLPLYHLYGIDGIVPAMIASSAAALILSLIISRDVKLEKSQVGITTLFSEGKDMVKAGVLLSLSSVIGLLAAYITRIYINKNGGLEDVGLFNAGFAIVNTYVGMVFTAMATDYYPRLSSVMHDKAAAHKLINNQAEIALLILGPILLILLIFVGLVVRILYSNQFSLSVPMIEWIALSTYFKAPTWAIGFLLIAAGKSRLFFINELIANLYLVVFNLVGYRMFGLEGLGISCLLAYIVSVIQNYLIVKIKFNFTLDWELLKIFTILFSLGLLFFLLKRFMEESFIPFAAIAIASVTFFYSIKELNSRISIIALLKSKLNL